MPNKDPEKRRAYHRAWIKARRDAYFAGKSCTECGSTDRLELDHIDPTTKTHHAIWSWSAERREAELAKCQPLCPTCHLAKSIDQLPLTHGIVPYQHGTRSMYRHGCRCSACCAWRSRSNAATRLRRKLTLAA